MDNYDYNIPFVKEGFYLEDYVPRFYELKNKDSN